MFPNCRNFMARSKWFIKTGMSSMNRIVALKDHLGFKFVHNNRFLGQSKEKVFIFNMSVNIPGNGVNLVKRMQIWEDMEFMDHVWSCEMPPWVTVNWDLTWIIVTPEVLSLTNLGTVTREKTWEGPVPTPQKTNKADANYGIRPLIPEPYSKSQNTQNIWGSDMRAMLFKFEKLIQNIGTLESKWVWISAEGKS